MKEKEVIENLRQVKEVFDRYNIEFWLDSGILLGLVRSNRPISWDNDLDLGMWRKDITKIKVGTSAYNELCSQGFDIYFLPDKVILEKNNFPINVSLFFLKDGKAMREPYLLYGKNKLGKILRSLWWLFSVSYYGNALKLKTIAVKITQVLPKNLQEGIATLFLRIGKKFGCREIIWAVPQKFFTNFPEITFQGVKFKVPNELEDYLAFRYGHDWRIPKKEWDSLTQDGAIEKKIP